ncbi:hypothetical protein ACSBR2_038940 [Camellia fascicularis]
MAMGLASSPLFSAPILLRRQLNHHHPYLFSTFPSPQLPFSVISRSPVEVEDGINDEACELVNGVEISIAEGDDSILTYLFMAVKNNNGTGILLLSDILGFENSSTRDFAYRVACNGYNVLVPDLFRGEPWAKERPKTLFEEWLAQQTPERIAKDITTSKTWMMDEFVAAGISKKLGIIRFCFGGGLVIDALAQDGGACFGIGVSFYGTRIDPSVDANIKHQHTSLSSQLLQSSLILLQASSPSLSLSAPTPPPPPPPPL